MFGAISRDWMASSSPMGPGLVAPAATWRARMYPGGAGLMATWLGLPDHTASATATAR